MNRCDRNAHRWHLDADGFLQDMSQPGWCVGASKQSKPAVVPCPSADAWVFPTVGPPWFVIKNRDVPDLYLGMKKNNVSWISCVPSSAFGNELLWRGRDSKQHAHIRLATSQQAHEPNERVLDDS